MKIYRYRLSITDEPRVLMPHKAQVLSVGPPRDEGDDLDLWAIVDPHDTDLVLREFRAVGTGNPMPEDCGRFVGTVPVYGGTLIFHVFEADPS